jgi:hypothetical protein
MRHAMKRRDLVKATGGVAATVAAVPLAVGLAREGDGDAEPKAHHDPGNGNGNGSGSGSTADHTETYKGRTIQVSQTADGPRVHIDGRELHLMRLGENAYLSSMCHYTPVSSPLLAGRQAVDELRGAQLLPIGRGHGHHA